MICHYCQREAIAKCISCGLGICADHGNRYCQVCSGAVFSREAVTGERAGKAFLQCPAKPEMPTIYLDDDGPPVCYRCEGLARKVCQNCHNVYCLDHAGSGDLCDQCSKASRIGTWVLAGVVTVVLGLGLLFYFLNSKIQPP